jgi:hypothetical protein
MEETEHESVADAVNAALGDVIQAEEPKHEDPPDESTDDGAEGTDESSDASGTDDSADDADGEGDQEGDSERNPDGTFKPKPKVDADGKPIPEAKKADPLNDPIPKDLKAETQERIRTLIKTTKEITAERDKFKTDFEYLINGVQSSGASPTQYGEMLSWFALFNSNDPAQQTKALELVESVADRLATLLGKERTVGDPLANHADLKDAVARNQITPQYAKEIARTRNAQGFRTQLQTSVQQEQQTQQQREQAVSAAKTALNSIEANLKQTDTQYDAKRAALVPVLQPVFKSLPPEQWASAFQQAYANLKLPAAAARRAAPIQQPMRAGKNPAGGQARAPGSMREALDGALANLGGK